MKLYADTSFLFSLYVADVNSLRALTHRTTLTEPLPFSLLNRLELRNAIELAVFRGRLAAAKSILVWQNVELDLQSGTLIAVRVDWSCRLPAGGKHGDVPHLENGLSELGRAASGSGVDAQR